MKKWLLKEQLRRIVLCFFAISSLPLAASAQSVVATLSVVGNPFRVAITPDGTHAYVLSTNSDVNGKCQYSIINIATNAVINTALPGINNCPESISFTPDSNYAYVTGGSNQVSVVNTATTNAVTTITVGISQAIATTPSGSYVYVGNSGNGAVSVINTATNSVVSTIPVGAIFSHDIELTPDDPIVISPDGAYIYVAANNGNISVISTATNSVVATIPINSDKNLSRNDPIAITPSGKYLYVGSLIGNSISVVNVSTNTVVATVPVSGTPSAIGITPDSSYVYVTTGNNVTSVINAATNSVVATIPIGATAVAITPNGAYVCVSSGQFAEKVAIISTATNTVTATVPVGFLPSDISITPDSKYAYAANYGDGTISVISIPSPPQNSQPVAALINSGWLLASMVGILCLAGGIAATHRGYKI